jgi:hypothetical protein
MRRVWILAGAALFSSAPLVSAQDVPGPEQYTLRIEGGLWGPSLASKLQVSGNVTGSLIDVPKDLDVGDKSTYEGRLSIQLGTAHKVRLAYTNLDYDGNTQITKEVRFQDTVYPRFTHLVTSIKGSYFAADYQWDFKKGKYGYVGGLFGAKAFDVDAALVAPERGDRDIETVRLPIPILGMAARGYYGRFSASGELSGLTIGKRAHFLELMMAGHLDISDHLGVKLGYRLLKMHGEQSDDLIDIRLSGLNFGAAINF